MSTASDSLARAPAIGIARAAYEATLDYVKERKAFGQPIGAFQMTQAKIADMKCKLDAALLLTLAPGAYRLQMQLVGAPVHPETLRWSGRT